MWNSRKTIPKDGTIVEVEAVWGLQGDDGKISYQGLASFMLLDFPEILDPRTGRVFDEACSEYRWAKGITGKVVPGRIVRWRPAE